MSHFVKKYTLRPDGQLAHLDAPAGACFLAAQHEAEGRIAIWLTVDSTRPATRGSFLVLKDEEAVSKSLAETLIPLTTLFRGIEATHLFVIADPSEPWDVLDMLITKQVTPDLDDDKKEDA